MQLLVTALLFSFLPIVQLAINEFYPIFLNEERCSGTRSWTMWFNVGKPEDENDGDREDMNIILEQNPETMCHMPYGIQAQSINYRIGNWTVRWERKRINDTITLLSFYSTEPGGVDFRVRYCCTTGTFIGTTTTTTTPMPLDNPTCGRQQIVPKRHRMKRIVRGHNAIPNSWPWAVYYMENAKRGRKIDTATCGATIIDANHVVTAAHCIFSKDGSKILLVAGAHDVYRDRRIDTEQFRRVEEVHIHPEYDSEILVNDIAVLRVDTPFEFNTFVQPICLPGPDPQLMDEVIIVGWGAKKLRRSNNHILRQAFTEVVDHCETWYPIANSKKQICIANSFTGSSSCYGDSGGPLLSQFQGQYVLSGISSYSMSCNTKGSDNAPNVYTRVSYYKPWIESVAREFKSKSTQSFS